MKDPVSLSPSVKSWASLIDAATRDQARSLGELPFIHPHIALMPDAHAGLGSAVGTVIPTVGVVLPAAVGVDIGCGMIAARTRYTAADLEGRNLTHLRDTLEHVIPLSPGNYNKRTDRFPFTAPRLKELQQLAGRDDVDLSHSPHWKVQLGTLGGGNHFIELCLDEDDRVWMFLHSGSRGVGNKIARVHIRAAQEQCRREGVKLNHPDHAYLREGTPEFDRYLRELRWAQHFALLNREDMMDRFAWALADFMGDPDVGEAERINSHHNYTEPAVIDGVHVWLTRKGAIDASQGRPGLIPGSMGAQSYVVEGLGNDEALRSAPSAPGTTRPAPPPTPSSPPRASSATTRPCAPPRTAPAAPSAAPRRRSSTPPPTWRRPWATSSTAPANSGSTRSPPPTNPSTSSWRTPPHW